ncbi:hypothetical protein U14_02365 [Candidatus Moduliflexus flocculans]|uniref:ABC transporter substrate binding protein n=1 Tax=Candidatus Moduliflexus flocculans TaxID=1499966 RepID=A0A0S6VZH2_9BACT|nr:hypothetical protein U14_02365 [Candidatus Moduliflexus flocculans]
MLKRRYLVYEILLCCLIGALYRSAHLAYAETPQKKILVLNSDASVEKYRIPQEEFQQSLGMPVILVDLAERKWTVHDLEELFYDESPDLVYCIGTRAYLMAYKYVGKTPIVFSSILNWLRLPITNRRYGVSNELHAGMEMMLFRHIFPEISKIGVLYSQKYTEEWFQAANEQAQELGLTIIGHRIEKKEPLDVALTQLLEKKVDAFWLIPDPAVISNSNDLHVILERCDTQKIPVFSYNEAFTQYGVVLSISVDTPTIGRQAAALATSVLAKEDLTELVQFPAGSYITLNLKKVKEYHLHYNEDALGSVNTILE